MKSVFAEIGASLQQIGGSCPEGWIVMQGERPTPEHVAQADGVWVLPVKGYAEELAELNSAFQKDIDAFNRAWTTAVLSDGPSEEAKLTNIRSQYTARKSQYTVDYSALRLKHNK